MIQPETSWIMVEAPGIESPDTPGRCRRSSRERRGSGDERRREVSATPFLDLDRAIRVAAKLAIDAGDLERARALLALLDAKLRSSPVHVLTLETKKPAR